MNQDINKYSKFLIPIAIILAIAYYLSKPNLETFQDGDVLSSNPINDVEIPAIESDYSDALPQTKVETQIQTDDHIGHQTVNLDSGIDVSQNTDGEGSLTDLRHEGRNRDDGNRDHDRNRWPRPRPRPTYWIDTYIATNYTAQYRPRSGDRILHRGRAGLTNVDVLRVNSWFGRSNRIRLRGYLPTQCHQLRIRPIRLTNRNGSGSIHIDAYSVHDPRLRCAQSLKPYTVLIPLTNIYPGRYTIYVNGSRVGGLGV